MLLDHANFLDYILYGKIISADTEDLFFLKKKMDYKLAKVV